MQTIRLTENLTQLIRLRLVNAYLVREADGLTLVDTAVRRSGDAIVAAAQAAGGTVRRIALTHGHGDHVGSLDELKERLGREVEVLMPEVDARIHDGEKVVEGKLPGSWPAITTKPEIRLRAGDRVGSLEVVASPGHTPGHISFLDHRDRTLLAGDVFTSVGGVAVASHFYPRFPFAALATWDKARNLESARALQALEPALLAVGHGPAVADPAEAIDIALARAERAQGR